MNIDNIQAIVFDFDGVFTDNTVFIDQFGNESVRCSRSDGIGLTRLKNIGLTLAIMSTETNQVVSIRAKKLKIECWQSIDDKGRAIEEYSKKKNIPLNNICFLGNDINDLPALLKVGYPAAVADAYEEVKSLAKYVTMKTGGNGAVREICDLIYHEKMRKKQ
ncbi:MAG: HAD hydrolase family protein [Cyclobacteriaceae bacterium]|nr:HAD hydrolase family protein [Cyclobacteriaceae bacterium]